MTEPSSSARPAVPLDVVEWLVETYTAEGVAVWLQGYEKADETTRERMIYHSRLDPMGT